MNKQEAIELLQEMAQESSKIAKIHAVYIDSIVEVVNEIDEPQKVVVPKFVAEWIERRKKLFTLYYTLTTIKEDMKYENFYKWFSKDVEKNTELLASAWIYGYTVEKEKRYTVEIPNPNLNAHVVLQKTEKGVVLVTVGNARWKGWESSKLTEAEIKKDFDFLWQFAKPVEEN